MNDVILKTSVMLGFGENVCHVRVRFGFAIEIPVDWYKVITVMSVHTLLAYLVTPTFMLLGGNMVYIFLNKFLN